MILHTNFLFKKLSFMVAKDEQNLEGLQHFEISSGDAETNYYETLVPEI